MKQWPYIRSISNIKGWIDYRIRYSIHSIVCVFFFLQKASFSKKNLYTHTHTQKDKHKHKHKHKLFSTLTQNRTQNILL